nr:heparan-alpha-glucosaminide N-acetyltransferase [Pelagibacterium xiamenense]
MTGGPRRPRLAVIDIARGLAILAMVVYHFAWDLAYLQFIALDLRAEIGWVIFQKLIVGSFIFLTGVSLVLAHGDAIRWRAFWRRFALVLGAAMLVTIGTLFFSPNAFVYFGVLHAIALFSLAGLAFLRAPLWLVIALGAAILATATFVQHPLFGEKIWSWIGLWDEPPPAEDLVPIFPWFGVALFGIAFARWARTSGLFDRLAAIPASATPARGLAKAGRWSLPIYLIHQPILLAILMGIAALTNPGAAMQSRLFTQSCEQSCRQSAGDAAFCTAYCGCALTEIEDNALWPLVNNPARTPDEDLRLTEMVNQCTADVIEGRLAPGN